MEHVTIVTRWQIKWAQNVGIRFSMSKRVLEQLEIYKSKHSLSDAVLSKRLKVYRNYPFRWRKAGRIIGVYEHIVEEFLKKEKENGRF